MNPAFGLEGRGLRGLHLFIGAGGGLLGERLQGITPIVAVEIDSYCRDILLQRQRDGAIPRFPIWDDIKTFDPKPWRGQIDIITGGFPCQDISVAGTGAGLEGERSGLWVEMRRVIGVLRPQYAFIENSPMLAFRGGDRVVADLAGMGFDCQWGVVRASDAGAHHLRARMWIFAERQG